MTGSRAEKRMRIWQEVELRREENEDLIERKEENDEVTGSREEKRMRKR